MRAKIDFSKVNTIEDIKSILEALDISWEYRNIPENIKHLIKKYDNNVKIINC